MNYRIIRSISVDSIVDFPEIDIVVTFFNHRRIVKKVLESVVNNCTSVINLVIIDDLSEDRTLNEIKKFVRKLENSEIRTLRDIYRVTILQTKGKSIFEVMTSNLGLYFAMSKYVIFLQGDQVILESKFDTKLVTTLELNQDIFCVSGRGIHRFQELEKEFNKYAKESSSIQNLSKSKLFLLTLIKFIYQIANHRMKLNFKIKNSASEVKHSRNEYLKNGRAGELNESFFNLPSHSEKYSNTLFKGQTVMRGPIAYRTKEVIELGGFDSESFYLGFDEHELNLKAFLKLGKICAYLPTKTYAIYSEGATRKKKSLNQVYLSHVYKSGTANKLCETNLFNYFKNKEKIVFPPESIINPFFI